MSDWEEEFLDRERKGIAEARELWRSDRKADREQMTVRAFLRCIGVGFSVEEVEPFDKDPPDVVFRDAAFEVTEDLGGRKRGDEWRRREKRFASANSFEDVLEPYTSSQPVTADEAWQRAVDALAKKAHHYGARCERPLLVLAHSARSVRDPMSDARPVPSPARFRFAMAPLLAALAVGGFFLWRDYLSAPRPGYPIEECTVFSASAALPTAIPDGIAAGPGASTASPRHACRRALATGNGRSATQRICA